MYIKKSTLIRSSFNAAALCIICSLSFVSNNSAAQTSTKRLSDWILEQTADSQTYLLGLSWRVPSEKAGQASLKADLLYSLSGSDPEVRAGVDARSSLRAWLGSLPVTGRVRVGLPDPRWLQANPSRDPILQNDQEVILPKRPGTVTVINSNGQRCDVAHVAFAEADAYIDACDPDSGSQVDWAWVAQPDGRVQRFGIRMWNEESQSALAPGAWIWAPARNAGWSNSFSERLIAFLATQGPSIGAEGGSVRVETSRAIGEMVDKRAPRSQLPELGAIISSRSSGDGTTAKGDKHQLVPASGVSYGRSRSFQPVSGDWGGIGLLQTPTSRMAEVGDIASSVSRFNPYTNYNFIVTPLEWLEAGFRYTSISTVPYSPGLTQAYKDKAFDAKLRLLEESAYVPEVALGFRDIAGTGLFSSEYFVANKRTGAFDWSLGLGWGYLGTRGGVTNPMTYISPEFESRPAASFGQGGSLGLGYFRGPASLFGGVQFQSPWDNVLLKLEYDGHDYQREPLAQFGNNARQRYPWNFGVVYRPYRALDVTVGVERGTTAMLTLTWHGNFRELGTPKLFDPAPIPVIATRPQQAPDWAKTARDITAQTEWQVQKIERIPSELRVTIEDPGANFWNDRVDRAASVLHRDAPGAIDRFVFNYRSHGLDLAEHVVERDAWLERKASALPPTAMKEPLIDRAPQKAAARDETRTLEYQGVPERLQTGLGFAYQQTLGGPDGFLLFQAGIEEKVRFRIREDTWLQGYLRLGLINNYEKFKVTGPSELPRVRTYLREYLTTSKINVTSLYLGHVGKITENQYYSAYGGYLETMFAGVGGEWLYRPFQSRIAFGVDVNAVQARGFKQDLSLRDYQTWTGHATLYWDTGWNGVQFNLSAGRYLAKDFGATFDFSRTFSNGARMGAYFTRTNVTPAQFGEGSYDKGVYLSIPFDTFLPKSTNSSANVLWRPLTRDGGAKLDRPVRLYDETNAIDARTLNRRPAPPLNETLPASEKRDNWQPALIGPQPFTRVTPRPFTAQLADAGYGRLESDIVDALYRQGFRNIGVSYDATHRLVINATSDMRPASRAAGRVARAALRLAPLDVREIRVDFNENGGPWVRYEFVDLRLLDRFFDGQVGASLLESAVVVQYFNPSAREENPLALLGDTSTELQPRRLSEVVLPAPSSRQRVIDDFIGAGNTAAKVDWVRPGLVGAGLILASSIADKRADRFAQDHASSSWVRKMNSAGNALPFLAIGGAAMAALDSSDPVLSRTGYAATEAGATALAAVTGLKYVFGRSRPENGLGPTSFKPFSSVAGFDSFPSGHTIISWAVVTPFAEEYDAPWLYGVAAITNAARVGSRQHWLSDTVAGSALGYGIGKIFWESARDPARKGPRVIVGPRNIGLSWALD